MEDSLSAFNARLDAIPEQIHVAIFYQTRCTCWRFGVKVFGAVKDSYFNFTTQRFLDVGNDAFKFSIGNGVVNRVLIVCDT